MTSILAERAPTTPRLREIINDEVEGLRALSPAYTLLPHEPLPSYLHEIDTFPSHPMLARRQGPLVSMEIYRRRVQGGPAPPSW